MREEHKEVEVSGEIRAQVRDYESTGGCDDTVCSERQTDRQSGAR